MKLEVEILAVETNGDTLSIKTQGRAQKDAQWRPMVRPVLSVPDTASSRKAFYVGRKVALRIQPL